MALRSKLLDERVVNLAKEMLKKVRNNAYVSKKLYQYSLLGRQMEHVINLLNSPVIGKKSSFSFVLLLTGLGITSGDSGKRK